MPTFKNPTNGYTESFDNWSMLWALLFGWIYFAVRGLWAHIGIQILIAAAVALVTAGPLGVLVAIPVWIFYAILTPSILRHRFLKQGWLEVPEQGSADYWNAAKKELHSPDPSKTPARTSSVGEELERLAGLRDRGVLTEAEFLEQKALVLRR